MAARNCTLQICEAFPSLSSGLWCLVEDDEPPCQSYTQRSGLQGFLRIPGIKLGQVGQHFFSRKGEASYRMVHDFFHLQNPRKLDVVKLQRQSSRIASGLESIFASHCEAAFLRHLWMCPTKCSAMAFILALETILCSTCITASLKMNHGVWQKFFCIATSDERANGMT